MTIHDLRLGGFETFAENPAHDAELLGYYPLVFYSRKTMVVPDFSGRKVLPPLVLAQDAAIRSFLQFMGSTPNVDSTKQNFVLAEGAEVPDVPVWIRSYSLGFDILARKHCKKLTEWSRFNLVEFDLHHKTALSADAELLSVSADLA